MVEKNDGGPAFPIADIHGDYVEGMRYRYETTGGMSLRDYFAAAALTAFVGGGHGSSVEEIRADVAKTSFAYADAMIAARGQK